MSEEEKKVEETTEGQDSNFAPTRRQFIVGAGIGLVAGAAGSAGILSLAKPGAPAAPAAQPSQPSGAPAAAQAAPKAGILEGAQIAKLNINGLDYSVSVQPQTTLLDVLKRDLGMTGVKQGCSGSMCSACTVLVDGVAMNSCSLLAIRETGKKITTVEGLAKDGKLHPVQVAFWENQGYQCGFCTAGQMLGTIELLNKIKNPTEDQIRSHMSGHLCKCGAYSNIIKSVQAAAKAMA
jgi:xanthine dehydrogenase YagT iron-sulfur-binding subunit